MDPEKKTRQCTVQLTVFAHGVQRIKPLLIFKGTGKRIPDKEAKQYDPRVAVKFRENAWCDEEMMIYWERHLWNSQSTFFGANEKRSRLLVYDHYKAHTTKKVKEILQNECKTTLALVPPGATSKVEALDVTVNSEFKKAVDRPATEAMTRNPDKFLTGKITAESPCQLQDNAMTKSTLAALSNEGSSPPKSCFKFCYVEPPSFINSLLKTLEQKLNKRNRI